MALRKTSAWTLAALSSPLIFDEDGDQDTFTLGESFVRDQRIDRIRELMSTRRDLTMSQIQEIVDREIPTR